MQNAKRCCQALTSFPLTGLLCYFFCMAFQCHFQYSTKFSFSFKENLKLNFIRQAFGSYFILFFYTNLMEFYCWVLCDVYLPKAARSIININKNCVCVDIPCSFGLGSLLQLLVAVVLLLLPQWPSSQCRLSAEQGLAPSAAAEAEDAAGADAAGVLVGLQG